MRNFYIFIFLIAFGGTSLAQTPSQPTSDSTATTPSENTEESVVIVKKEKSPRSPIRASLYSAILPGAGQIYNRKWWKVPLVWGGFATAYVMHDFYYGKYQFYHQVLIYKDQDVDDATIAAYVDANGSEYTTDSGDDFSNYSQSQIQSFNDQAQKRTQQIYLASAVFYLLQIVDASVDAHFSTYDVSDDLSFKIKPTFLQTSASLYTPSLSLKLSF